MRQGTSGEQKLGSSIRTYFHEAAVFEDVGDTLCQVKRIAHHQPSVHELDL